MIQQYNSYLIRNYVRSIFQNKGKLLFFNLLVLIAAAAVILFWPREYRSEAKVWIKIGRENSKLDPTAATGETIAIQENDREDEIKSVIDIMGSRGVVEKAVDKLGIAVVLGDEPLPGEEDAKEPNKLTESIKAVIGTLVKQIKQIDPISDREEAVQEILKKLYVDAERKSNVVSVLYDCDSPALAQAVVETVINEYKLEHTRIHKTEGSKRFFGEQLSTLKNRVKETSEAVRAAKNSMGLASVKGHRDFLELQVSEIGQARLVAEHKLEAAKALTADLRIQIQKHPLRIQSEERLVPSTERDAQTQSLYNMQLELAALEAKHRVNDPRLASKRKAVAVGRQQLDRQNTKDRREITQSINTVHQELALDLARASSEGAGFAATLRRLDLQEKSVLAKIAKLNEAEIEITDLERNRELAISSYQVYAENMEDARVDEELNQSAISNVSIAQRPTMQEKPISPSKLVIAALTLAAMLFGSIAIISGMVMIDDSVSRLEEVADIVETPVVISVPNHREFRHVVH